MVDDRLATPITADANDFIYQWEASHDYNPSPGLEKIEATLLADQCRRRRAQSAGNRRHGRGAEARQERPPVPDPGLSETRGHLTTGNAKFYKKQLEELLQTAPQRAM